MNEIWKDVPGYEGLYQVSNMGNVKSLRKDKIMSPAKNKGYYIVNLKNKGQRRHFLVHRLIWDAFNGPIPPGLEVNHINEEKTDNRLSNLNLMTHKENINWGTAMERASKSIIAYDKAGNFVQEFKSGREACKWLNNPHAHKHICDNLKGRRKSAYGYVWKYV